MDLDIKGKHALVCGGSKGLGYGCARALAMEGARVTLVARGEDDLRNAASDLGKLSLEANYLCADVSSEEGRQIIVDGCKEVDILINNAGGPKPSGFREWSRADWISAFDANALSAVFLTRAFVDGMIERRFGRIINITSLSVKQPQSMLGLSTSARLALTGFVASIARELAEHNVTINNLLPGYFDTSRLRSTLKTWDANDGGSSGSFEQKIPAKRFGTAEEFGAFCAFFCSGHASYMTGQNVLLDGGLYGGTL